MEFSLDHIWSFATHIIIIIIIVVVIILIITIIIIIIIIIVLSPKGQPVKTSPQAWNYFNPGNQATLQRMFSDCGAIWKTWRGCQETSVVLCQAQPYSEELPSSVLTNWHSNNADRACTAKPANKGMWCQFNVA